MQYWCASEVERLIYESYIKSRLGGPGLREGLLDAGDEAAQLVLADAEGGLEHLLGKGWVGVEEGDGELGGAGVLAVEGGEGEGGLGLVGVKLEVDKATREDEEIAGVDGLVEELVVWSGGDEAHEELALGEEEDLGCAGVHVGRVDAAGLVVDAGSGEALRVEATKGGGGGEVDC
ncbi:hypothetical protein L7F22_050560 [Adiantum nelumboides]|nr:hypothetical protein [Adiantum nelumboides]